MDMDVIVRNVQEHANAIMVTLMFSIAILKCWIDGFSSVELERDSSAIRHAAKRRSSGVSIDAVAGDFGRKLNDITPRIIERIPSKKNTLRQVSIRPHFGTLDKPAASSPPNAPLNRRQWLYETLSSRKF